MSKKRQQLVDIALALFMKEGFHATGIDRIAEVSGISKTTMYRHFPSKELLIRDALQAFSDQVEARWQTSPEQENEGSSLILARFEQLSDIIIRGEFTGCVFLNASAEFPDEHNPIHQVAIAHKHASLAETRRRLALCGIDEEKALIIELIYEGLLARLQVEQNLSMIQTTIHRVRSLLDM
ncbi:MAG: TetR family transcriptional regulator [Oceanospirillaceae bacterium]|nr:TetR family transcriptional regulator [Oceanospirillaceae bacterium]